MTTPPQHSDEWLDEAIRQFRFGLGLSSAIQYEHLHDSVGDHAVTDFKQRVEAELKKREAAARIDELRLLWPKFTDIKSDGTNGLENNPTARRYIDDRLAQLHKEQPENVKGSEQNE